MANRHPRPKRCLFPWRSHMRFACRSRLQLISRGDLRAVSCALLPNMGNARKSLPNAGMIIHTVGGIELPVVIHAFELGKS
jgi:hypothetical protein